MEKVKLTVNGLKSDIASGLTRKELANKYNISSSQIAKAITKAGLKGKRATMDKFELVDDSNVEEQD